MTTVSRACKDFFRDNLDEVKWTGRVGIIRAVVEGVVTIITIRPYMVSGMAVGFEVDVKGIDKEIFWFVDFFKGKDGLEFKIAFKDENYAWHQSAPTGDEKQCYIDAVIDYVNAIMGNE
jgi:hypothetical protein